MYNCFIKLGIPVHLRQDCIGGKPGLGCERDEDSAKSFYPLNMVFLT